MRAHRAARARARRRATARRATSRARRGVARRSTRARARRTSRGNSGWAKLHFSTRDVDALAGASARDDALGALAPTWRTLLLSDGSVTRHLSVLGKTGGEDGGGGDAATRAGRRDARRGGRPTTTERRGGDAAGDRSRVERCTCARERCGAADGRPAVYAASWWNEDALAAYLPDEDASMWANLRTRHVELHREIREVYYGESEGLEAAFGERGPFWGRHYIFWSGGAPITVVYEVFNPAAFERALGPLQAGVALGKVLSYSSSMIV